MLNPRPSAHIHLLAPNIAERIAAGEMIERPASVVKELIENSLDSGATEIAIILEQGGKDLIEIIDNGAGMVPEDLELCIERHATSKLSTIEDLDRIETLGFRGEALASIAAVTDLQIVSRAKGADSAYELVAGDLTGRLINRPKAKKITFGHFIHSPHGTRIQARGLFSQVPARLKFLKSQSAEVSQIREWVERIAIAHPHVGFQLVSEDRNVLRLPPSEETERVRTILSDGDDFPVKSASNNQDGFRDVGLQVRLHWLQGLSSHQSRKLIQIVNGRAVKDRILQQAILAPFRQLLLPGQYPAVALLIDVNPAAIDVNVHPTKTEIRFLDSRKIFSVVDSIVKSLVSREGAPAYSPNRSFAPNLDSTSFPEKTFPPYPNQAQPVQEIPSSASHPFPSQPQRPDLAISSNWIAAEPEPYLPPQMASQFQQAPGALPHIPQFPQAPQIPQTPNSRPLDFAKYVGPVFNTYLIYEKNHELILVDQHAAHERIRYEKLRNRIFRNDLTFASQSLLLPEVIRFLPENHAIVNQRLRWIIQLGFDAEIFGEDSLVFRAVPAEWGMKLLSIRLKNLVDRMTDLEVPTSQEANPSLLFDEALFESLAREACHSAIRAGDALEAIESQELVRQLFECEHPWNCPHGRPTVVKVPQAKLEEWFLRKL